MSPLSEENIFQSMYPACNHGGDEAVVFPQLEQSLMLLRGEIISDVESSELLDAFLNPTDGVVFHEAKKYLYFKQLYDRVYADPANMEVLRSRLAQLVPVVETAPELSSPPLSSRTPTWNTYDHRGIAGGGGVRGPSPYPTFHLDGRAVLTVTSESPSPADGTSPVLRSPAHNQQQRHDTATYFGSSIVGGALSATSDTNNTMMVERASSRSTMLQLPQAIIESGGGVTPRRGSVTVGPGDGLSTNIFLQPGGIVVGSGGLTPRLTPRRTSTVSGSLTTPTAASKGSGTGMAAAAAEANYCNRCQTVRVCCVCSAVFPKRKQHDGLLSPSPAGKGGSSMR